jgi:hypothetical protein
MFERLEPVLKGVCIILAALLLFQVGRAVAHSNPLAHLKIPPLPSLPADTNAPPAVAGTNSPVAATNKPASNSSQPKASASAKGTNALAAHGTTAAGTNIAASSSGKAGTNPVTLKQAGKGSTNSSAAAASTNVVTNVVQTARTEASSTNSRLDQASGKAVTNSATVASSGKPGGPAGPRPPMPPMGMNPFGGPAAPKLPELALPVLARVDKITDSEILGQVIRPLPKALLGIAGNVAFLRAANGQTGMVKEGDDLAGLKLLRIGTNRVLVEQEGKKEELTIFNGYGGDALIPN